MLSSVGFAEPPTVQDYIDSYSKSRGNFFRDHDHAKNELKKLYEKITISEFNGNLIVFYTETSFSFSEYKKERDQIAKRWVKDYFITPGLTSCIDALNELVTEKTQLALDFLNPDLNPNQEMSGDLIVNFLIKRAKEFKKSESELHGAWDRAKLALESGADQTSSLPLATLTGVAVGLGLFWFGPAYLMIGTEKAFNSLWYFTYGSLPSKYTFTYWLKYAPTINNLMGYVYLNSDKVLMGTWSVGSPVFYGTFTLGKRTTEKFGKFIFKLTHFFDKAAPEYPLTLEELESDDWELVPDMNKQIIPYRSQDEILQIRIPSDDNSLEGENTGSNGSREIFGFDVEAEERLQNKLFRRYEDAKKQLIPYQSQDEVLRTHSGLGR
jgi:hypothetical protein